MTQRRSIINVVWALLAVVLGVYAQSQIREPDQLNTSLLLYAVATIVFVIALRRRPADEANILSKGAKLDAELQTPTWGWTRAAGLALILVSVAACGAASWLFREQRPVGTAWTLYLFSMVGSVLGVWLWSLAPGRLNVRAWWERTRRWRPAVEHILLIVLLLLSFGLRFYRIEEQPFGVWYDEADNSLWAREIVQDADFRPVMVPSNTLPSHFLYFIAGFFRLFGETEAAMRLPAALFGMLSVWATYLLSREWWGKRMGLVAAFIMMVAHWNVNFSRVAMHGISTPFFIIIVAYFLLRGLRTRRLIDFALAGLGTGLSLCFYVPNRLYPFVIAFLFSHLFLTRQGFLRRYYRHLLVYLIVAIIAFAPVGVFILRFPEAFFARTQHTSVFKDKTLSEGLEAVKDNAIKHLLMFNYRGDGNGRHNLPGEPMLDFVTSVFFVLGLGYTLYRVTDPRYAFLLVGFVGMLSGGVLSLDFEAPQSLRAIGTLAFSHLIAFAALARLWREFDFKFGARWSKWAWVALAPMLLYIGYDNIHIYFVKQANDFAVWNAYSTPETLVARRMVEWGDDIDYRVISLYFHTPTMRFLAPDAPPYRRLETTDSMPLANTDDRDVVLFLDAERKALYQEVRRYYPNAHYEEITPPFDGPVVLYICRLTPAQVKGIQGLIGTYYAGEGWDGEVLERRQDLQISFDWSAGTPLPQPFSVVWQGTLRASRHGTYRLGLRAPAEAELYVDETLALDGAGEAQLSLAEGNHAVRLQVVGAPGVVDFYWQPPGQPPEIVSQGALFTNPPVTNNGLLGRYYQNTDWAGEPALTKIDPTLALYFHILLLPRPYSVEWTGKVYAPVAGNYAFGLESIDDSWLYVNERLVVETHVGNQYQQGYVTLTPGLHDIRVRYLDKSNWSHINLYWQPPNEPRDIIPAERLFPPQGAYPEMVQAAMPTPSGPALQQGLIELVPIASWGRQGDGAGEFHEPRDVAVGDNGWIYVADTGNRRVQMFDQEGNHLDTWQGGEEPFQEPLAVVVNSQGEVLVLDSEPGWIYRFSAEGNYMGRFGGADAQLYHPRGMAIDDEDTLYVADTGGGQFVLFEPSGAMRGRYGTMGSGPGQFLEPTDVAIDAWNDLYAVDVANRRIQHMDVFGRFKAEWALPLANAYNGPHIALAADGTLLVTAPETGLIQRYGPDGTLLGQWGEGLLHMPVNLTLSGDFLYVTDTFNHRIQVFEVETINES